MTLTVAWTNIEDEILKAAVSKYGLNQWARVSSLLARKTAKQCKSRWVNWLAPDIRKTEWSKEEDEKLLHLAKLMPTQWASIAPVVGRTATQCLERYQKLLDEAEARESNEMGLMGPDGAETAAPTADDVRRLRPGEVDPDPESKPARPDAIDLDEDMKEMLSEARARLANTQGKKAKRKARERQLEDSHRLAQLQKRRELKAAGINTKITTVKKGMNYNADIPFEKAPAPGFYDTAEEKERNERQREAFDPRKKQLANKRKGDQNEDADDRKKRKNEKNGAPAGSAAAAKAAQMQKIREAEQSSKRRALVLPSPQVSEGELEEIVKIGMAGDRSGHAAGDGDTPRGLAGTTYSHLMGATPIRTPRAAPEEDRVANEIRNARARNETQSVLFGGENAPLFEGNGTTGFDGVAPSKQQISTPNPLATPLRQGVNGVGATPMRAPAGPGSTPMRTPRDSLGINRDDQSTIVGQTPRDIRVRENAARQSLRSKLAALPKPQETEWDLELPEEQQEASLQELTMEDAAERDRRNLELRRQAQRAEFKRQTQVMQRSLPRPSVVDIDSLLRVATNNADPVAVAVETEMAMLIANDAFKFGGAHTQGASRPLEIFDDSSLSRAKMEIALELSAPESSRNRGGFESAFADLDDTSLLPGLRGHFDSGEDERQLMLEAFDRIQTQVLKVVDKNNIIEKKLQLHLGGYQQRSKVLYQKIADAATALEKARYSLDTSTTAQVAEEAAIARRLGGLRDEVSFISRREREAQDLYRARKDELDQLQQGMNGHR